MIIRTCVLALGLTAVSGVAFGAGKSCEDLRSQIDARIQAKGVHGYSLDIVTRDNVGSAKVVGSCDGGAQRIVYSRGEGLAAPAKDRPKAEPAKPQAQAPAAAPQKARAHAAPKPAANAAPAAKAEPKKNVGTKPPALGNY